jgi:hypothetical protein
MPAIKNPKTLQWTAHARAKMRQYGFSESRLRRVMNSPARIEEGIAPDTIAMMQRVSARQEIWLMIAETPKTRRVVSAWRYPGQTKLGNPLPPEVLRKLRAMI